MADHRHHGEGEHHQGNVAVPAMPGSALVVIETKLVLRSLEAVLDRPPVAFGGYLVRIKSAALACAALGALLSTSALADILTETYTGTVSNGLDAAGLFGPTKADLLGLTYTATYVFDTAVPGAAHIINPGKDFSTYGGGVNTPAVSAAMTINGHTFTTNGLAHAELDASNMSSGSFRIYAQTNALYSQFDNFLETQDPAAPYPTSLSSPFTYTSQWEPHLLTAPSRSVETCFLFRRRL